MKAVFIFVSIAIIVILLASSFGKRKCEHIFTRVEQPVVSVGILTFSEPEIVCVKCFHRQAQKVVHIQSNEYIIIDTLGALKIMKQ